MNPLQAVVVWFAGGCVVLGGVIAYIAVNRSRTRSGRRASARCLGRYLLGDDDEPDCRFKATMRCELPDRHLGDCGPVRRYTDGV